MSELTPYVPPIQWEGLLLDYDRGTDESGIIHEVLSPRHETLSPQGKIIFLETDEYCPFFFRQSVFGSSPHTKTADGSASEAWCYYNFDPRLTIRAVAYGNPASQSRIPFFPSPINEEVVITLDQIKEPSDSALAARIKYHSYSGKLLSVDVRHINNNEELGAEFYFRGDSYMTPNGKLIRAAEQYNSQTARGIYQYKWDRNDWRTQTVIVFCPDGTEYTLQIPLSLGQDLNAKMRAANSTRWFEDLIGHFRRFQLVENQSSEDNPLIINQ